MKVVGKGFPNGNNRDYFVYLYYDSTKAVLEKNGIEKTLIDAKKALKGKIVDKNGGLKRTYQKYLIIDETKSVIVNNESVNALLKEAGYFWIV